MANMETPVGPMPCARAPSTRKSAIVLQIILETQSTSASLKSIYQTVEEMRIAMRRRIAKMARVSTFVTLRYQNMTNMESRRTNMANMEIRPVGPMPCVRAPSTRKSAIVLQIILETQSTSASLKSIYQTVEEMRIAMRRRIAKMARVSTFVTLPIHLFLYILYLLMASQLIRTWYFKIVVNVLNNMTELKIKSSTDEIVNNDDDCNDTDFENSSANRTVLIMDGALPLKRWM